MLLKQSLAIEQEHESFVLILDTVFLFHPSVNIEPHRGDQNIQIRIFLKVMNTKTIKTKINL